MRRNNRLSTIVGVLTLLLGLLFAVTLEAQRTAGRGSATWLPSVGDSRVFTMMFYDNFVMVVGFVLSPLLVFAVGYQFGRQIDLPQEYRGVFGALLIGSVVGYGLGRIVAVVWVIGFGVTTIVGLVIPALVITSVRVVFAGFAGIALGYLRTGT